MKGEAFFASEVGFSNDKMVCNLASFMKFLEQNSDALDVREVDATMSVKILPQFRSCFLFLSQESFERVKTLLDGTDILFQIVDSGLVFHNASLSGFIYSHNDCITRARKSACENKPAILARRLLMRLLWRLLP